MSTTNLEIVTAALQKLCVIDETQVPSAEQGVTGLSVLNDVLADHAADGVNLGWYPQTDLAATAPLQEGDVNGVKLLLTRSLGSHYGITIDPPLAQEILDAETRLIKRTRPYQEANLSELPRGQGPYGYGGGNW